MLLSNQLCNKSGWKNVISLNAHGSACSANRYWILAYDGENHAKFEVVPIFANPKLLSGSEFSIESPDHLVNDMNTAVLARQTECEGIIGLNEI